MDRGKACPRHCSARFRHPRPGRKAAMRRSCIHGIVSTCSRALPSPAGGYSLLQAPGAPPVAHDDPCGRPMSPSPRLMPSDASIARVACALRPRPARASRPSGGEPHPAELPDRQFRLHMRRYCPTQNLVMSTTRPVCRCRAGSVGDVIQRIDVGMTVAMTDHPQKAHAE